MIAGASAGAEASTASGTAAAATAGTIGLGTTGALGRKAPGRAASAEKPQKAITGLPSTTYSVSSPGAVRAWRSRRAKLRSAPERCGASIDSAKVARSACRRCTVAATV